MNDQPTDVRAPKVQQRQTPRWQEVGQRLLPSLATAIRLFVLVLIGVLVVFVARDWDWWRGSAARQVTDDAYLKADLTPLAAKSPGYVRSVSVRDFQRVKAGALLVEIVDDDYRAAL